MHMRISANVTALLAFHGISPYCNHRFGRDTCTFRTEKPHQVAAPKFALPLKSQAQQVFACLHPNAEELYQRNAFPTNCDQQRTEKGLTA